ncbi:MAG TPA: TonB-dependent receptor, partial [bacterium]
YLDYDWTMQVISDLRPNMKLRLSSLIGKRFTMEENWTAGRYMISPEDIAGGTGGNELFNMFSDWAWSLADIGQKTAAAKLIHTLNKKTFYEMSIEFLQRKYNTRPTADRDTETKYEIIPGYYLDEGPFGYAPDFTGGILFGQGEQASMARDHSVARATTFKADVTSQLNFENLAKAGIEIVYNDLNLDYGVIEMQTSGKSYKSRVQRRSYPIRGSGYIQNKLETKGFIMNAGLRLDYSDSRTYWWAIGADPYNPYFISSKFNPSRQFAMQPSEGQWQLSPRLGISHPITENSKLFFNYGHFKQMPQYDSLFTYDRNYQGQLTRIGDPNLILAKTISYELGYDHSLFNNYLVQVTAFYKDITDQQNSTSYYSINNIIYRLTTSNTYQDIGGFEFTLRKTSGRWLSGFANYTYQVSSRGNFGQGSLYEDPAKQKVYDEKTINLYQQRPVPAPYARAVVNLHSPDNFGPSLLGHNIFGGFMVNLFLDWAQGGWTTYNPKVSSGVVNNVQYVDYFNSTLRASKSLSYKKMQLQLLVDVNNLFNNLRLRNRDNQQYRMSLHLPPSKAYDNIPGTDKLGDYRRPGVAYQPMEYRAGIDRSQAPANALPIYYEGTSSQYWQYTDNQWTQVSQERIDQINQDKAYIDMPSPSTYWFVNPRSVIFGARISFDLN